MKQVILMADIVDSGSKQQNSLITHFKTLVEKANEKYHTDIRSPLTITLGDEFQGIIDNISAACNLIIYLEETIISKPLDFKLRYVLHEGKVETPINPKIAYEMLGPGLTKARQLLVEAKKSDSRSTIAIDDQLKNDLLTEAFIIYENIVDRWNIKKDHSLIYNLITKKDYKIVAEILKKERSLIWKREKTLNMSSYHAIKNIIQLTTK